MFRLWSGSPAGHSLPRIHGDVMTTERSKQGDIELLPCPFCGHEPYTGANRGSYGQPVRIARCGRCYFELPVPLWNTRIPSSASNGEMEKEAREISQGAKNWVLDVLDGVPRGKRIEDFFPLELTKQITAFGQKMLEKGFGLRLTQYNLREKSDEQLLHECLEAFEDAQELRLSKAMDMLAKLKVRLGELPNNTREGEGVR